MLSGVPHDLPLPLLGGREDGDLPCGDDDLTLLLLDPPLALAVLEGDGSTCLDSSSLCLSSSTWNPSSKMIGPPDDPELADDDELVPSTVTHRLVGGPGGDDLVLADLVVLGVALAGWTPRPPPVAFVVVLLVVATIVALNPSRI